TRRPAEWAHVPPAARGVPLALAQAPVPVELAAPGMTPPRGVDTITLPLLPDPKLARATSTPEWLRQQGMRVLWTPLFATRDGRRVVRSSASLDSLVALLDAGGFNLLAGDASAESTDSLHVRWEERDAVRRAWADAVKRLQPTRVAWIPLPVYANARPAGLAFNAVARCEAPACYPGTTAPWRTRLPPAPRRSGIGCCGSAGTSTSRSGWRNRRPIGSRSACSAASGFRTGRCSCSHRSYGPATCSRSTARAASTSYTRSPSFHRRSGHATGPASSGWSSAKVTGSGSHPRSPPGRAP